MRGKRLSRLLQVISLLRGQKNWNTRTLAEHFSTSRRNIHRDLAVLELAGVPFYYDPQFGDGGGYQIKPTFWFPTIQLSSQECIDLAVLTRSAETGGGIPLLDSISEVRDKLLATLSHEHQDTIREASELFEILTLRLSDHSRCRKIMIVLQQSLLNRKQVEGLYESPHGRRATKVHLQPRRVFLAGSAWYAACFDNQKKITRLYRLARFKELKLTNSAMTISKEFSLRDFLGNAWVAYRGSRDWHIEILFDRQAAPMVAEVRWHQTQKLLPQKDGSLIFRATVSGLEEIKYWVLNWGPRAKVLKPRQLADEVCKLAQDTCLHYCNDVSPKKLCKHTKGKIDD